MMAKVYLTWLRPSKRFLTGVEILSKNVRGNLGPSPCEGETFRLPVFPQPRRISMDFQAFTTHYGLLTFSFLLRDLSWLT